MKCKKCGARISRKKKFCGVCGAPVPKRRWPLVVGGIAGVLVIAAAVVAALALAGVVDVGRVLGERENGPTGYMDGDYLQLNGGFTDVKVTDEDSALDALDDVASALGIEDVGEQLSLSQTNEALDTTFYRYAQMYEGIPVYGRSVAMGADKDGETTALTSNYLPISDVDTDPKITEDEALETVADEGDWSQMGPAGLCVYSLGDHDPALAWQIDAYGASEARSYFVDAASGEILTEEDLMRTDGIETISGKDKDDNTVDVEVWKTGENSYELSNDASGLLGVDAGEKEIQVFDTEGSDENGNTYNMDVIGSGSAYFLDSDGKRLQDTHVGNRYYRLTRGGKTVAERAFVSAADVRVGGSVLSAIEGSEQELFDSNKVRATTAFERTQRCLDFYRYVLGRKGFNGEYGSMTVVAGTKFVTSKGVDDSGNAMSLTVGPHITFICFGHKNDIALDTVAHEFTHSVEATLSSMVYEGESGALMEATSDIFGELVEDYNDGRMDNSCDWLHTGSRNISKPGDSKNPAEVGDEAWGDPGLTDEEHDNGYVHNNSTVVSHAAYLMCNSDGLDGEKLSTDQLAQLVYLSFMLMPSDCTFEQFRAIAESVAQTMIDSDLMTEENLKRISAAFDEVKIGVLNDEVYRVTKDAKIQVLDVNSKPYADYTVTVQSMLTTPGPDSGDDDSSILFADYDAGGAQMYAERAELKPEARQADYFVESPYTLTPTSSDPMPLEFEHEVSYRLTVEDANSDQSFKIMVMVADDGRDLLTISTPWGDEVEQTKKKGADSLPEPVSEGPGTRDVALVLDISSSMSGNKMTQMCKGADGFVDTALASGADVGLVSYSYEATIVEGLTSDEARLSSGIASLSTSGNTNIEDGLRKAEDVLAAGDADKQIIVLMSDGAPNEGMVGDELIAYAEELKEEGVKIYTVGFEEGADGYALLSAMASDGCHYEVSDASELKGFFTDIADEIAGTRFVYVRAACPVDVTVRYDGEELNSSVDDRNTRTSFGTIAFEDELDENGYVTEEDAVKVLRLREGPAYDIDIEGTGEGSMDYSIGFADSDGDYTDFRTFDGIDVEEGTEIATTAEVSDRTRLTVDIDGDGILDEVYEAKAGEDAEKIDNSAAVNLTVAGCAAVTVLAGGGIFAIDRALVRRRSAA